MRASTGIFKRVTGFILLLALAAVFIISGWSKLQTIDSFAWSFIDILPVGITAASVTARLFIGLEWMIGAWLAAHIFLRRITYKATLVFLILLTVYLIVLIIRQGNTGDCGCFGEWMQMKPLEAIWKNLAMIAVVALLYFYYPSRPYRYQAYIALALTVAAWTMPFLIEPIFIRNPVKIVNEPVDLRPLYQYGMPTPSSDLKQGKHIICFFSTTCPHCIKGADHLQRLHRRYPDLPVYMVLNGTGKLEKSFLAQSNAASVPHTLISSTPAFVAIAGEYVPAIFWINNSRITLKTHYIELEPVRIKEWLRK